MKRRILLFAVLLSAQVWGGDFTLEDCIGLSLKNSAAAQKAALDENIAGSRIGQARSGALPQLSLDGTYTRLDELQKVEFGDEVLDMGTLDNYSVDASVRQLIFSGGKVNAALNAASIARDYASSAKLEIEETVKKETTTLFNNILLAEETVNVFEESLDVLEKLVAQTEAKKLRGKAAEFDVLTAQVRYENEKPQLIKARNSLAVMTEAMKNLIGTEKEFNAKGKLEYREVDVDRDALIKLALQNRPLVNSLDAVVRLRKESVAAARSDLLPSVNAFFTYNGANSYRFVSFGEEAWEWHWNAGVALNWSIWDGDLTRNVLKEKNLEYRKAQVDLDDNRRDIRLQVKEACLRMNHARESVAAASKNVGLAEKAMDIASARHESGLSTYLDYTDANVALKRARLEHMSAVCSYLNALADLKQAVGVDFEKVEKEKGGAADE